MMGLEQFFGMRGHFHQLAVHAVADAEPVFHGLNVDVGSPHFESVRQHLLHQPDNGSILPFQPVGFFRNAQIPVKFIQPAFYRALWVATLKITSRPISWGRLSMVSRFRGRQWQC